jgi:hypothetical protein
MNEFQIGNHDVRDGGDLGERRRLACGFRRLAGTNFEFAVDFSRIISRLRCMIGDR